MNVTLSAGEKETRTRKDALRTAMRNTRDQLSRACASSASRRACAHLAAMPQVLAARTVAVYSAIRGEADPSAAAETLWARGVTVAFPRVVAGVRTLRFHAVTDTGQLVPGAFGIASPTATSPEVPLSAIDVVVVPGLAFDRRGVRLGWGRGHYDATLTGCPGVRIGFAYHRQLIECVPDSDHDQAMDFVVTETGAMAIAIARQRPNHAPRPRALEDKE